MPNVTWRRFDQSAKQLVVGHTTIQPNVTWDACKILVYGCMTYQSAGTQNNIYDLELTLVGRGISFRCYQSDTGLFAPCCCRHGWHVWFPQKSVVGLLQTCIRTVFLWMRADAEAKMFISTHLWHADSDTTVLITNKSPQRSIKQIQYINRKMYKLSIITCTFLQNSARTQCCLCP